jgi:hypothetical protein
MCGSKYLYIFCQDNFKFFKPVLSKLAKEYKMNSAFCLDKEISRISDAKFEGVMILEWIESVLPIQCLITTTYFTYMAQEDKYLRLNVYFILGFY